MGVRVPVDTLPDETLRRVVEEFVSREATDYGYEVSFDRKVEQVLQQLRRGDAALLFDEALGTTHIVPAADVPAD